MAEKKYLSIDELLNALEKPNKETKLRNTKETWKRIGLGDPFVELGLGKDELSKFLETWIEDNPYKNI